MSEWIDATDPYTHAGCGGDLELRVSAGLAGMAYSVNGYALDELEIVWTDDELACRKCGQSFSFAEWQAHEEAKASAP